MNKELFNQLLPLYSVIFLGFLGYALTITLFIPMLMDKNFALLPLGSSTSWRASLSGLLLAMYPLGQFLGSPIIGKWSDHFGRKKTLIISLLLCVLGFASMAVSIDFHCLSLLFISTFLTGLCESNMAIAQSVIANQIRDPAQKTKYMGYAYSACSLGFMVGPLVGGSTSHWGYSSPFWLVSLGIIVLVIWIFTSLKDTHTIKPNVVSVSFLKSLTAFKSLWDQPKLFKIYFINFLIFFAVQGLYRVVPLYVMDEWRPSLHIFSLLIAYVSMICFLTNLFILPLLVRYFKTKVLLTGLLFVGAVSILIILLPERFYFIWLTFGLAVIPTIMTLPTCTAWLSQQVSSHELGQVLGNNQALLVLGEASSAAIGGMLAAVIVPLPILLTGIILLSVGLYLLLIQSARYNIRNSDPVPDG